MSLPVIRSPESLGDLAGQIEWYHGKGGRPLARRFIDTVNETVRLLATHPLLGKAREFRHPKLQKMRFYVVARPFNRHLIFYRVRPDALDLFRVMHGMRDLPRRLLQPPGAD